jgi:hypothetical protein
VVSAALGACSEVAVGVAAGGLPHALSKTEVKAVAPAVAMKLRREILLELGIVSFLYVKWIFKIS